MSGLGRSEGHPIHVTFGVYHDERKTITVLTPNRLTMAAINGLGFQQSCPANSGWSETSPGSNDHKEQPITDAKFKLQPSGPWAQTFEYSW